MTADPYGLERFVTAQEAGGSYRQAVAELRRGRKTSHWIWFVFPQVAGLGASPASVRFSIGSLDEARAYLGHPVLGPRLSFSCGETRGACTGDLGAARCPDPAPGTGGTPLR